jgi:hypothetical protein
MQIILEAPKEYITILHLFPPRLIGGVVVTEEDRPWLQVVDETEINDRW